MIPDDVLFSFFKNSTACETVRNNHGSSEHCTFGFKFHNFIGNSTDDTNSDCRTPSRATLTRWQRFRKKSGATAPNRATVPLDDVNIMHEGRATLPISTPITTQKKKKRPRSPPRSTRSIPKMNEDFFLTRPLSKLNSLSILPLYNSFPHVFQC